MTGHMQKNAYSATYIIGPKSITYISVIGCQSSVGSRDHKVTITIKLFNQHQNGQDAFCYCSQSVRVCVRWWLGRVIYLMFHHAVHINYYFLKRRN